jgi:hypothetical protein
MKKVLVIGCSHATGAYDMNDAVVSDESWAWHLHKLRKENEQFFVLHNPGQGILQYGATLNYLHSRNLLTHFDACIIQMTDELRTMIYNSSIDSYYQGIEDWLMNSKDGYNVNPYYSQFKKENRVISPWHRETYELHERKFSNNNAKESWLDVSSELCDALTKTTLVKSLYPVYYFYIVNMLKQLNIEPIVFDFWGKELNSSIDHIKSDEWILDSLMTAAKAKGVWLEENIAPGLHHHNSISNKCLAEIINDAIITHSKLK